jgi:hypothetical protein
MVLLLSVRVRILDVLQTSDTPFPVILRVGRTFETRSQITMRMVLSGLTWSAAIL